MFLKRFQENSVGGAARYASDTMKKLPEIDFEKEVRIRPYAFRYLNVGEAKEVKNSFGLSFTPGQ